MFNGRSILLIFFLLIIPWMNYGQTCCSGGVPISSNLGFPAGSIGTWQFSLSYDINVLKTLKEGSETLDDDARERITQSILFQTGYSITNKISTDIFFSYVKQDRNIQQFGYTDYVSTNGFGDAALLLKYSPTDPSKHKILLTIATGPKFPTGRSDIAREDGIPLNADLQPGSGSWDGLFWTNGIYKFSSRPTFNISTTVIYSYKGKNMNYLNKQTYQFGNELQAILSLNDNFQVGKNLLDVSVNLRFREALRDRFNDTTMPNTGGTWLFIAPSLAYNFSQKLSLNANVEMPLYTKVESTQLSPTYRLNIGMYLKINKKNEFLKL